jgi:hypothetical protein
LNFQVLSSIPARYVTHTAQVVSWIIVRLVDSQTVEIIGRNYLVTQLVRDGVEVARPERDRGVDLVAYLDLDETQGGFVACPIQMKAATNRSFGVFRKYERFTHLMLVYVWHVQDPSQVCAYALSIGEALEIAEAMDWTKTESWRRSGYSTTQPSKRLLNHLEPHLMKPGDWKKKVDVVGTARTDGIAVPFGSVGR